MASIVQFVDSIAASPTVRLDLNSSSSGLMVSDNGIDLSPPPLRQAIASTMLTDGAHIAASAFENRIVKLPIKLAYTTTTDAAATVVQNLGRELNRPSNILKVQLDGATSPVFFRTFRSSYALSMLRLLLTERTEVPLELDAEPFALGLLETPVSAVTVSTDPAAATNPCYVDVTGVKGDVESPAIISWPVASISNGHQLVSAVRRRGTPASAPFVLQAEAMTQGTNTTTQPNDANFSGAGNNYSRCTFTTATLTARLSVTTFGTSGIDLRGRYKVFMRYRKNTSTDGVNLQLRYGDTFGASTVTNDAFATPDTTNLTAAYLGEFGMPIGADPVRSADGVELAVSNAVRIELLAERTSGAGTVDFDLLVFVPADDRLAITEWTTDIGTTRILDAADTSARVDDASGVRSGAAPVIAGGYPLLSPGQTNRIYLIRNVAAEFIWSLTTVSPVSVSYMPRYLSVRPAST